MTKQVRNLLNPHALMQKQLTPGTKILLCNIHIDAQHISERIVLELPGPNPDGQPGLWIKLQDTVGGGVHYYSLADMGVVPYEGAGWHTTNFTIYGSDRDKMPAPVPEPPSRKKFW